LASWLYGDPALRTCADLDIMVRPSDAAHAIRFLAQSGYRPEPEVPEWQLPGYIREQSELGFRNDRGLLIELQWQLAPRYLGVSFDWNDVWLCLRYVTVGEQQIAQFSEQDHLLALSIHGAKDRWCRLIWICDIAEIIARGNINWDQAAESARSLRAETILYLGVRLACNLLQAEPPAELTNAIDRPAVTKLASEVESYLFDPKKRIEDTSWLWFYYRVLDSRRDRMAYAARLALTPKPGDWSALRLPKQLSWLYYVIRAFRLMGKAPQLLKQRFQR